MAHHVELDETFTVVGTILIRAVRPRRGQPYRHACDQDVFEQVVHTIDELEGAEFTIESLRASTDLPFTQIAVTIAFLKERGLVIDSLRRKSMAVHDDGIHLDAMTEWHALREKGPPPPSPPESAEPPHAS